MGACRPAILGALLANIVYNFLAGHSSPVPLLDIAPATDDEREIATGDIASPLCGPFILMTFLLYTANCSINAAFIRFRPIFARSAVAARHFAYREPSVITCQRRATIYCFSLKISHAMMMLGDIA